MSEIMESKPITVALIGSSAGETDMLFHALTRPHSHPRRLDAWFPYNNITPPATGTYTYMEQVFHLICRTASPHGFGPLAALQRPQPQCTPYPEQAAKNADVLAVACNAVFLEDGLSLLSHVLEAAHFKHHPLPAVLCIAGCELAEKRGILIDFDLLEDVLQIPVVPYSSRVPSSTDDVKAALTYVLRHPPSYDCLDFSPERLAAGIIRDTRGPAFPLKRHTDPIIAGTASGGVFLLILFFLLFWFTFAGGRLLQAPVVRSLAWLERQLYAGLLAAHIPDPAISILLCGILRPIFCVISVMLPPLMLFLPLFFLLEEAGGIPQAAIYADPPFAACGGCGMQCVTMAAGLCCHTEAILECRRISSPRERMAAVLTASFMPCSGRIYMLLSLIPLFTAGNSGGGERNAAHILTNSAVHAAVLLAAVLLGASVSLGISLLLSHTSLRHLPSFFVLELTPYCRPQLFSVVLPAALERLSLLLGRAASLAALSGLLLWILAHIQAGGASLLAQCTAALSPLARMLGLDGTILTAFILGMPANEIILPLIATAYSAQDPLLSILSPRDLRSILLANGWTWQTACSAILFTLFQCPCLSAVSAIRQETRSIRWTLAAALLPMLCGFSLCFLAACIWKFFF